MSWRFVERNKVLQAGHWKSLKTSITTGALFEPRASCGSTSGIEAAACGIEGGCAARAGWVAKQVSAIAREKRPRRARYPAPNDLARRFTTDPPADDEFRCGLTAGRGPQISTGVERPVC